MRLISITRHALLAAAVAALLVGWSGVALATGGTGGGDDVPEISLGAVTGAMTLLSGGLLLARESLRSRKS